MQANFVTLSTIHQAKGLEWNMVFIIRFEEGVLPVLDAQVEEECTWGEEEGRDDAADVQAREVDAIEEERRLAYVALTRAKEKLYLR